MTSFATSVQVFHGLPGGRGICYPPEPLAQRPPEPALHLLAAEYPVAAQLPLPGLDPSPQGSAGEVPVAHQTPPGQTPLLQSLYVTQAPPQQLLSPVALEPEKQHAPSAGSPLRLISLGAS